MPRIVSIPSALLWGALLLAGAAAGCGADPTETAPGGSAPGGEPAEETPTAAADETSEPSPVASAALATHAAADAALTTGRPLTVRLELSPELAALVRHPDAGDRTLRLTLEGLVTPPVGANVRAFLNVPDADLSTPLDSPHLLGEVAFFPLGDYPPGDSGFLFDAGPTLADLDAEKRLVDDRYLDVTLVLVPPDDATTETVQDVEIAVGGVRLEAVAPETPPPGGS